jgi:hypothetical protein
MYETRVRKGAGCGTDLPLITCRIPYGDRGASDASPPFAPPWLPEPESARRLHVGLDLIRHSGVNPSTEDRDPFVWPGLVAGHRTILESLKDGL